MAAAIVEKAGAPRVANMRGGLLEYQALGLVMENTLAKASHGGRPSPEPSPGPV
jgi:hypothetical protein